ncbi:serpentine type 7TM GPCR chemoreceptor srh domain-containing protein [Ditylenchus destructor]|uniref:Serpentine type 7TM GPCR chemoreceptor srh domain-containing protein n=1 Tax=Ditylenchus destructor TaxID=166010 RepID=A0AAD4NGD7_9BILA|nr:serpentine type 7TM GPCR chemoreceptor srh domain-containing protein [Ditylenchus destructor]
MYINTFLALVTDSFAAYLIMSSASATIGVYKCFLLNIVFTSLVFDVYITLFMSPFPLYPAIGYCSTGLFKYLGLFWGAAIPFAIYRLTAVFNTQRYMTTKWAIVTIAATQIIFPLPTITLASLVAQQFARDQSKILATALQLLSRAVVPSDGMRCERSQTYPKLDVIINSELCIFASFDYPLMTWTVASSISQIVICTAVGITVTIMSFVHLNLRKKHMSRRSFQLHRQLIFSLAMQFAVPGNLVELGVQVATSHSLLNTITMIVFTKPYRKKVATLLRPFTKRVPFLSGNENPKTTTVLRITAVSSAFPSTRSI